MLTVKQEGKAKSFYVPEEMLKETKRWMHNYRKIKKLMADIATVIAGFA